MTQPTSIDQTHRSQSPRRLHRRFLGFGLGVAAAGAIVAASLAPGVFAQQVQPQITVVSPAQTTSTSPSTTTVGDTTALQSLTVAETEGPYFKANSPEATSLLQDGMQGTVLTITGQVLAPGRNASRQRPARLLAGECQRELRQQRLHPARPPVHRRQRVLHPDHRRTGSVSGPHRAHPRQGPGAQRTGPDHAVVLPRRGPELAGQHLRSQPGVEHPDQYRRQPERHVQLRRRHRLKFALGGIPDPPTRLFNADNMTFPTNDYNNELIEKFRANNGAMPNGAPLLLLSTTGARSGQPRVNPLAYTRDGDRYVIIASKGGYATNPDWYHNLVANPEVTVEVGDKRFRAEPSSPKAASASDCSTRRRRSCRTLPTTRPRLPARSRSSCWSRSARPKARAGSATFWGRRRVSLV